MYLHIGNGYTVRSCDIVGIFDIENTSLAKSTRDYLANAEKLGRVVYAGMEMPKSFVVCFDRSSLEEKVYVSQLACATLLGRANNYRKL